METIFELGVQIVLFLQGLGDWLAGPMELITSLGYEQFYLFIAPAIFWCLDVNLGLRMGLYLMTSASLNNIFKLAFHGPRPYWYDPKVVAHTLETSFGAPSGHSQNAVVVWGTLAAWFRERWAWAGALALIFLIGVSRLFLGVHFPHDVLLGWLIGALLLWLLLTYEGRLLAWFKRYDPARQILVALGASLALILVGALARAGLAGWRMPAAWLQNALAVAPGGDAPEPLALSGLISNAGTFFGLAWGGILLKARGGFDARGPARQRLARFLIGLAGVLILWYGLGEIFPRGEALLPFALRYLRYTLIGLWIAALAPYLFIRLGLAHPESK
ncbi:MAG: phosphatase PAP2 family protein [Anaerolineales bacterium]|nr:phosphatase PAP2 family protein [Anaerolineales bacterium]